MPLQDILTAQSDGEHGEGRGGPSFEPSVLGEGGFGGGLVIPQMDGAADEEEEAGGRKARSARPSPRYGTLAVAPSTTRSPCGARHGGAKRGQGRDRRV